MNSYEEEISFRCCTRSALNLIFKFKIIFLWYKDKLNIFLINNTLSYYTTHKLICMIGVERLKIIYLIAVQPYLKYTKRIHFSEKLFIF